MSTQVNERTMRRPEYWIALCSVCLVSVLYYGIRAAAVMGLAAVTAVLTDFVCLFLQNRSYKTADLSNAAAAVIMTLMFPASIPYSIVILSTVFAIAVGVHIFGSRGTYLFHPSAVGYLFALLCWKHEVLQFPKAGEHLALFGNDHAALQPSLSSTFFEEGTIRTDTLDLLLGAVSTPMGTGCLLLLLFAMLILLFRRCISVHACIGYFLGISLIAITSAYTPLQLCAVNMVLFAAVFLAADPAIIKGEALTQSLGGIVTGMVTCYLILVHHLEYAPVIAVLLSCPVWHALAAAGSRIERFLASIRTKATASEPVMQAAEETEADA